MDCLIKMKILQIQINWEGPYRTEEVITNMTDRGKPPEYGVDFGLYQIYGTHILCGKDTLLYIGKAPHQTFSTRFKQHKKWLDNEDYKEDIRIYLGRIYDPKRHSVIDAWESWTEDVKLAEKILIYKYSPHYNNSNIGNPPNLGPFQKVVLIHKREKHKLIGIDDTSEDF